MSIDKNIVTASNAIVQHMPGWSVEKISGDYGAVIAGPDDKKLWVGLGRQHPDKLHIHGVYPTFNGHDYGSSAAGHGATMPAIGVSMSKTPEQVVKDIERRLLPAYEAILAKAKKLVADAQSHDSGSRALLMELAKITGNTPKIPDRAEVYSYDFTTPIDRFYGGVRVNSPTSVEIHIRSAKPNIARAVLKALKETLA